MSSALVMVQQIQIYIYIYCLYTNCSYNIRSTDDISSGYSSAEPVSAPLGSGLSRTSSMTNASKARAKSKRNEVGSINMLRVLSEVLPYIGASIEIKIQCNKVSFSLIYREVLK